MIYDSREVEGNEETRRPRLHHIELSNERPTRALLPTPHLEAIHAMEARSVSWTIRDGREAERSQETRRLPVHHMELPIEGPTRARSSGLQLMMRRPSPMLQSRLVDETAAFPNWALSMALNQFLEGYDPAAISNRHRSMPRIFDPNEMFAQFVAVVFGSLLRAPGLDLGKCADSRSHSVPLLSGGLAGLTR